MSGPFQLTFTLRQHTPIIHFQWHEKDATIRPTELKAKLDKWIISTMTDCYGNAEARLTACKAYTEVIDGRTVHTLKNWLKGAKDSDKTHPALNYSVRINPFGKNEFEDELNTRVIEKDKEVFKKHLAKKVIERVREVIGKDYPTYFGNQLKVEEFDLGTKRIKRLAFHKGVQVFINSPYDDLISKIITEFPLFILKTNFGTRQGKGFGSFFIDVKEPVFPKSTNNEWFNKNFDWKFDVDLSTNKRVANAAKGDKEKILVEELFRSIDLFYKTLRSGISPHDKASMYFKSMMWRYAMLAGKQWDKKTIKQGHFSTQEADQQKVHSEPDTPINWNAGKKVSMPKPSKGNKNAVVETHLIWRDILGLSSQQTWMSYGSASVNKSHVEQHTSKELNEKIARFKSPIIFKPIRMGFNKFRVFFEVPHHIKNAFIKKGVRADVEESAILGEWFSISGSPNSLELPYPDHFNFDNYFKHSFSVNPLKYVQDGDNIYTYKNGISQSIPKEHGLKYSINKYNNKSGKKEWVKAAENNPDLLFLTKVYSELARQVEDKQTKKA